MPSSIRPARPVLGEVADMDVQVEVVLIDSEEALELWTVDEVEGMRESEECCVRRRD